MNPAGAVTFQTFGRDKAREDAFRKALLGLDGLQAEISSGNVANPQCLALSFARDIQRYPGFSLIIDLDEADMKVRRAAFRFGAQRKRTRASPVAGGQ